MVVAPFPSILVILVIIEMKPRYNGIFKVTIQPEKIKSTQTVQRGCQCSVRFNDDAYVANNETLIAC